MNTTNLRRYISRTLSDFLFWARYGYWPRHYRGLDEVNVTFTGITLPKIERTEVCPTCVGYCGPYPDGQVCQACLGTGKLVTPIPLPPLNINEIATVQPMTRNAGAAVWKFAYGSNGDVKITDRYRTDGNGKRIDSCF